MVATVGAQGQSSASGGHGRAGSRGAPYVVVRETHSAVVLLVGEHAYKLKKPVAFDFLDFSTPELRRRACERELELNQRLAADVYLGVGEIHAPDGAVMESFVLMRRMPDAQRLSRLVRLGADVQAELRAVARAVAEFHERCDRGPAISADGTAEAVALRWQRNLDETREASGTVVPADLLTEVAEAARRYVAGRAALFETRIAEGAVIDGHGDLLADDIFCLPDGPRILDCLDFDDALRHLDRVDDIACLVMDLERLGAARHGRLLLRTYRELTGDTAPASLVDHYVAYRAFMRAKVCCLQVARTESDRRADATHLLMIAAEHLRRTAVRLVLVGGAPGTGKTSAAGGLADAMGAVVLSSDRLRKELAGVAPETSAAADFEAGLYSPAWTRRTYEEMLRRARQLLSMGETVVLDATWADGEHRAWAQEVATATSSALVAFRCDTAPDIAAQRIARRPRSASDADAEVARRIRERFEPWPGATTVDTGRALAATVSDMYTRLRSTT